jgi:hypothetical protein
MLSDADQAVTLPMRLNPSRKKGTLFFIGALLFAVVGFFMVQTNAKNGWMVLLFFGACALAMLMNMLPNASSLLLTEEGFTVTSLSRSSFTPWKAIESFGTMSTRGSQMVAFTYNKDANVSKLGRSISAALAGGAEGALPDTYGMSVEALLKLMTQLHARYR